MPNFDLSTFQRPLRQLSMRRKKTAQTSSSDDDAEHDQVEDKPGMSAETAQQAPLAHSGSAPFRSRVANVFRTLTLQDAPLDSWHPVPFLQLDAAQVAAFREAGRRINQTRNKTDIAQADRTTLEPLRDDVEKLVRKSHRFFTHLDQKIPETNQLQREARSRFGMDAVKKVRNDALFRLAFSEEHAAGASPFGRGLAIGEDHTLPHARKYLITHMQRFKEMGVKTLYTEVIKADTEKEALDAFNRSGELSADLRDILRSLDCGVHDSGDGDAPTLENLFRKANQHGITIKACDNLASACGIPMGMAEITNFSGPERAATMNYVGFELIRRRQKTVAEAPFLIHAGERHFTKVNDAYGLNTLLGIAAIRPTQDEGFEILH